MRGLTRIVLSGAVVAGLAALLRRLFEGQEELLGLHRRSEAKQSDRKAPGKRSEQTPQAQRNGDGPSREELYAKAKRLNIEGRSKMNKSQLARAVGAKERS